MADMNLNDIDPSKLANLPLVSPNGDVLDPNKLQNGTGDVPFGLDTFYGTNVPMTPPAATPSPDSLDSILGPGGPSLPSRISSQMLAQQAAGNVGADEETPAPASVSPAKAPSPAEEADDESEAPASKQEYMKSLLSKIYGQDLSDDSIKGAQGLRNRIDLAANLSKAGQQVGAALSKGAIKPEMEVQNDLIKNADQGVTDIMQRRQAKMQEIEAGMKASDLEDKEKLRDSDSDVSEAYRDMAAQLNPKLAEMPGFDKMNAEGIKQLLPMVDMSIRMSMLQLQKQTLQDQKKEQNYNKAQMDLGGKIEQLYSPRGAAGRASIMTQAADRLNAYANQFKDKNSMTPQEVELLVKDLGTMMSGGIATEGSSKRIMPPALSSRFANLVQLVSSGPSGAGMGDFVQRMQNAADELRKVSKKYELEHVNNLVDLYKPALKPETYQGLKSKYSSAPEGKITVTNGKETYVLNDPADLPHAIADGFTPVAK